MTEDVLAEKLDRLHDRLRLLETALTQFLQQHPINKEWYSVDDAAEVLGKAPFTVREWCRLKRVNAHKRPCGRGRSQEWILSQAEIERIRNKGLLPQDL